MIKKILFCTDGSSYSYEALKYTAWLSNASGAEVTALYVSDLRRFEMPAIMDVGGSLGIQPYQSLISSLQEAEKEKAKLLEGFTKDGFAKNCGKASLYFKNTTGLLADTIEDFEKDFDIVVMGKRGESADFAIDHIGSTLERVIRSSSRPCLVTNREYREIKTIAFAYDDGESCRKLITFLEGSEWLKNYPLHLLSVAEEGEDEGENGAKLKIAEERLQNAGYSVQSEMLGGLPEDSISDYVDKSAIDLLLMGAYGHTRIRRFFIGSTTTEMLRRCRIPILCYH